MELTSGYNALRTSAAWIDVSERGKIRALGEDRKRLLHAMTTNQVQKLEPGQGCYAFFLNAQGRILGDVNLFVLEDCILLDTEPEEREKLREHIDRYIIADDVTLEDATDSLATIALEGRAAEGILTGLGAPIPAQPHGTALWGARIVARASTTGSSGFLLIVPREQKDGLIAQLTAAGVPRASREDQRTIRIENGHPRYGEEISERYLVQETAQMEAVSFEKGCYLGQEIVERVRSRAQIHRILRAVEIDGEAVPEPGTKFKSGEEDAGEVASAAYSPKLGRVAALGYIRTRFAAPAQPLTLNGIPARVR
jgi:folate-binding protein YgfZ